MQLRIVDTIAGLEPHAERWTALARSHPATLPMQTFPWVAAFFEHRLAPEQRWFCVLAFDRSDLVGVAPFVVSRVRRWRYEPTVLWTPRDDHVLGVDLLAPAGREAEIVPALLRAAAEHQPGVLYAELGRIVEGSPTLSLPDSPWLLRTARLYGTGAYLPTVGDYQDYRRDLSKNFRSNLNKAHNKVDKMREVRVVQERPDRFEGADFDRFVAVERACWKGREGTAIGCSEALSAFYRTLTRRLADAGMLEWHFLEAEGTTLAANLAIRFGRSIVLWKLGYDEAYRKCSPGSVLLEHIAARAFADEEIDQIDMTTDQPWYDNWNMKRRNYYDVRLHRWAPGSLLADYVPRRTYARLSRIEPLRRAVQRVREAAAGTRANARGSS